MSNQDPFLGNNHWIQQNVQNWPKQMMWAQGLWITMLLTIRAEISANFFWGYLWEMFHSCSINKTWRKQSNGESMWISSSHQKRNSFYWCIFHFPKIGVSLFLTCTWQSVILVLDESIKRETIPWGLEGKIQFRYCFGVGETTACPLNIAHFC